MACLSEHELCNDGCLETYGAEHSATKCSDDCLYEIGSQEDLILRGWKVREAARIAGVEFRKGTGLLLDIKNRRLGYFAEHVMQRVGVDAFINALQRYGEGSASLAEVFDAVGLRKCGDVSLGALAEVLGVSDVWKSAISSMQAVKSQDTADVWEQKYGVRNISQLESVKQKKKATSRRNYGADSFMQTAGGQERMRAAIRERYGVDNVSQVDEVKAKKIETSRRHFGTDYPQQSLEVRRRQSDALKSKHGIDSDEMVYPFQIEAVREKAKLSCVERYGVDNPFKSSDVQEAIKAYWRENYGVDNASQVPWVQQKRTETFFDLYGVGNPFQADEIKTKIAEVCLDRYGFSNASQSPDIRAKVRRTVHERYGVDCVFELDFVKEAALKSRKESLSTGISIEELDILSELVKIYGFEDISFQYGEDSRYPFLCDFYIKSRDLFIELNGTWTHGTHWYCGSDGDNAVVADWGSKGTNYYRNAVLNWTQRDVKKREIARKNKLNYVVFWDGSERIDDARLWFAMGCPDGKDWEREYSWLPDRTLLLEMDQPALNEGSGFCTKIARWANGREFYRREIEMWERNEYQKDWGTLQAQLYANRYKYLKSVGDGKGLYEGKLPDELTDWEIVRGLGIMGKLRAYTTFDNTAMRQVIAAYDVESVLDPCAGWGERMATCIAMDVAYLGIDVNERLSAGYARLVDAFGDGSKHRFVVGDSATESVEDDFDAVITCPPYGSLEIYSDAGAENLDEGGFAAWWDDVVGNIGRHAKRLFCVQTNQACKEMFGNGLEKHGWKLLESIPLTKRSSHMTRGRGGVDRKREFEEMLVFGKE